MSNVSAGDRGDGVSVELKNYTMLASFAGTHGKNKTYCAFFKENHFKGKNEKNYFEK